MGFLTTNNKKECYGCYACAQACPKNAIDMLVDKEGFEYPTVDMSKCVGCDICKKVCPAENEQKKDLPLSAYALVQNDDILMKSSSGGAFWSIVNSYDENAVFYGVSWKTRSKAEHSRALKDECFEKFRKSKYVQSIIGDSFVNVKNDLVSGLSVVFVGTPCQIAGLKQFLKKDYDNLLTIDLICHGVPSSKMLETYFCDIEKKTRLVSKIEFRHKQCHNNIWNSKYALLTFDDGSSQVIEYDTSAFLRGYDNGLFFRPSCSTCQFACRQRVSDITIGDYWGSKDSGFDVHKGTSLVMVNSEKGRNAFSKINSAEIQQVDYEQAASHNARLNSPDKGHPNRTEFFERLEKESFSKLVQEYAPKVPDWKKFANKVLRKIGLR